MNRLWMVALIGLCLTSGLAGQTVQPADPATAPQATPAAAPPALDPHPVVALTFDDLPAAGNLPRGQSQATVLRTIAAELKAHGLQGVYGFAIAEPMQDYPEAQQALRIWVASGMNIGNHTWSHPSLTDSTAKAFEREIARDEPTLIGYARGRDWHWFRYPYLIEGDTPEKRQDVRQYLKRRGYRIAQVTLDFEDDAWNDAYVRCIAKRKPEAIEWLKRSYLANAEEYIRLGRREEILVFGREIPNVMLMHGTAFTALMLPEVLDLLRKQGFAFAQLAEVEKDPAYSVDPGFVDKFGGTLPGQIMNQRKLPYPLFEKTPMDKLDSICR
jgi:peptidoglycan/xylan/chitin deacetylase (PgdA/CDA1 family)